MASIATQVSNPTAADVTVNAKVAKSRRVTLLNLDDTTNEAEQFIAAGCALVGTSANAPFEVRQQAAFLLLNEQQDVA